MSNSHVYLTERQRDIFENIWDGINSHGYPPTVRELCDAVGLASTSSVKYQLDLIEKQGLIARDPRRSRTIEITELGDSYIRQIRSLDEGSDEPADPNLANDDAAKVTVLKPSSDTDSSYDVDSAVQVPLVGRIAAGAPILAEQHVEEVFPLPRQLTGTGDLFMLLVSGDSMIDAAICDGDWVVVRRQPVAENGEIVAAVIDGEATVKVFQKRDGHIWLLPRNADYAPIPGDDAQIVGKVVSVLRAL
ncbi:repressor LexA [Arcanobacterium pluranimalium]|uniref:transcriptional repressor LexA n=1 Tax=Arcanobacterium pluranimalium TaxID=108028 RepID=UPI00195DEA2D|nr:transcriptional repressor LexA [Arcanobacterium pluranimalium]MBM7825614.1 repressor LexA [Arcanobacterium pluranimalium]